MHHAVGVLAAVELRAAPFHAGVRRAFENVDAVDARKALQLGEREDQRPLDQAMYDQPIVFRIDLRDAGVMALEAQPARRDDAVELVQRREAHRGLAACGQPLHVAADGMGPVPRWLALGPRRDAVAERTCPFGHVGRQVFRIAGERRRHAQRGTRRGSRQEAAARGPPRRFLILHGLSYHAARGLFYGRAEPGNNFPEKYRETEWSMIPKSGCRFSEKIMLHENIASAAHDFEDRKSVV